MLHLAFVVTGEAGEIRSAGSAVDEHGHVFVVGTFDGELAIGGERVRSAGGTDVFVMKLDRAGGPVWVHRLGGPSDDLGESIVALPDGQILVTGSFAGELAIGDERLVAVGTRDVFVARLDGEGRPLWGRSYGTPGRPPAQPDDADAPSLAAVGGELRVVMLDGGWADVWLNGVKLQTTAPLARYALPAGRYEVRLENAFSGLHQLEMIEVAVGETVTIRAAP